MPLLHWLNREKDVLATDSVPYRLLESVDDLSYGDKDSPNMLIQGDNLEALKALLPYYAGQVKCVFIDPPYNTKSAFEHYDDNLEHAQWLSMMYPRLELLRELLAEDGSIWVTIDDNEAHYLKVIMDEIFGRKNFVSTVIWQKKYAPKSDSRYFSQSHDFIYVYAKKIDAFNLGRLPKTDKQNSRYTNKDNDPRGAWKPDNVLRNEERDYAIFPVVLPSGREVMPPSGTSWRYTKEKFAQLIADNRIWFGMDGNARPAYKRFLSEVTDTIVSTTVWLHDEVGHNDESKKEMRSLFGVDLFGTPKPERLLQRIFTLSTQKNDLVLDSCLGSGTTAAVAHKMGLRYIGIEMGEHAQTHCQPRLKKVVDGEQGGISEAVNWQSGGGFRFYKLGATIFDADGNINPAIRFAHLAAHIWFCETKTAFTSRKKSPLLGVHDGVAYYLLYNGILGDKTVNGGNVLTLPILKSLPAHDGMKVIYGETSRLSPERLKAMNIVFKQTPYDVKAR